MNAKQYKSLIVAIGVAVILFGSKVFAVGMAQSSGSGAVGQYGLQQNLPNQAQVWQYYNQGQIQASGQRRGLPGQGMRRGPAAQRGITQNQNRDQGSGYSQEWLDGYRQGLSDSLRAAPNAGLRRGNRQGQFGTLGVAPNIGQGRGFNRGMRQFQPAIPETTPAIPQRPGMGRGFRQGQPGARGMAPNAGRGRWFGRGMRQAPPAVPETTPTTPETPGMGRGLRQYQPVAPETAPNSGLRRGGGRGMRQGFGRGFRQGPAATQEEAPVEEPNL